MYTSDLLSLEMLPEDGIDDLGNGQVVEIGLPADRLDPTPFDVEGGALSLLAGIARLEQSRFAILPPDHDFLKIAYHRDKHLTVDLGYTWSRYLWGNFRRGRSIELLEAIMDSGSGDTKAFGNLGGREAFSSEGLKLGLVNVR